MTFFSKAAEKHSKFFLKIISCLAYEDFGKSLYFKEEVYCSPLNCFFLKPGQSCYHTIAEFFPDLAEIFAPIGREALLGPGNTVRYRHPLPLPYSSTIYKM